MTDFAARSLRLGGCLACVFVALTATSARANPPSNAAAANGAATAGPVRCLLLAPFENTSDARGAGAAATTAVAALASTQASVLPLGTLRGLFKGTWLELPAGVSPELAFELALAARADGVIYGTVEGRAYGQTPNVTLTVRLARVSTRELLLYASAPVVPEGTEKLEAAVQRTATRLFAAALPSLAPSDACFATSHLDTLRGFAHLYDESQPQESPTRGPPAAAQESAATVSPASKSTPATPDGKTAPDAAGKPAAKSAAASPSKLSDDEPELGGLLVRKNPAGSTGAAPASRNSAAPAAKEPAQAPAGSKLAPRQAKLAKQIASGERFVVPNVAFKDRLAKLEVDSGLLDLAAALKATPGKRVLIEAFVDATHDAAADEALSAEMAKLARDRLVKLGVPAAMLDAAGRGGKTPIAPNLTSLGKKKNRRLELSVL